MNRKTLIAFFLLAFFSKSLFCQIQTAENLPPKRERPFPPPEKPPSMPFENFRGRRKPVSHGNCCVRGVNLIPFTENGVEYIAAEIFFTQSIDPRSVRHTNILINSFPLESRQRILFNKSATCIRLTLQKQENLSLSIDGILSYNAEPVPKVQLDNIECGCKYFFSKEDNKWKKF